MQGKNYRTLDQILILKHCPNLIDDLMKDFGFSYCEARGILEDGYGYLEKQKSSGYGPLMRQDDQRIRLKQRDALDAIRRAFADA